MQLPFTRPSQRPDQTAARPSWRTYAAPALLITGAVVYLAVYIFTYSQYPSDDAYIHLRIARHLAEHNVPYYNPDQAVAGGSSLFWLILLGGLFKLISATPLILPYLTLGFTLGAFAVCTLLLQERFSRSQALVLAFFLVATTLVNVAALLMETPAAIFFWLLAVRCWQRKSFGWMGFFSAMAFLTRYEFAVWLIVGLLMLEDRRTAYRYVLGGVGPALFFVVFNLTFFATLIPNTVTAKSQVYPLSLDEFLFLLDTNRLGLALFSAINLGLLIASLKHDLPRWMKACAFFPLALFGMYCMRKVFMFSWYWPNVFFPLSLAYLLIFTGKQRVAFVIFLFSFSPPLTAAVTDGYGLFTGNPSLYREYDPGRRVQQYLRIGAELDRAYPDAVLMTSEIGGLGWGFPGRIIDAVGLVSPESLRYHPMAVPEDRDSAINGSIPPQAIQDLQPNLVVSMETFSKAVRRDIANGRLENYYLLQEYPVLAPDSHSSHVDLWGAHLTQVFSRSTDLNRP
ncbi:MAG: hypothetical protein H0T53_02705 [Herpetosiphonaceae bacterium]|nr:hypothetical protein [Herpetosiphonaceae bacterium]